MNDESFDFRLSKSLCVADRCGFLLDNVRQHQVQHGDKAGTVHVCIEVPFGTPHPQVVKMYHEARARLAASAPEQPGGAGAPQPAPQPEGIGKKTPKNRVNPHHDAPEHPVGLGVGAPPIPPRPLLSFGGRSDA